jgi:AcrR family transcriptional regulator
MTVKDPSTRSALIDAAARIVNQEGARALSVRRLADKVGVSTMAVYTYFDGMAGLARAVREDGFERLSRSLDTVSRSKDPVSELFELGLVYFTYAVENPDRYRFMFMQRPEDEDLGTGIATFDRIADTAAAAVGGRRFRRLDAVDIARRCWVVVHGAASLHLVGMLDASAARESLEGALASLFVGLGDDPGSVKRSVRTAKARYSRRGAQGSFV